MPKHNRASRASRRERRRKRARLRDLRIYGTSDLQEVQQIRDATASNNRELEALLIRGAVAYARATGRNQWVVRDRLANHAPRIVPASCRTGGTYGVGIDGSTLTPTRHGEPRTVRYGRAYRRRSRGVHYREVDGIRIYDCDCGCRLSQQELDLQSAMHDCKKPE